jgi:4-coumarate--CoA ligase
VFYSGANPDFSVGELGYQIEKTKPALIVTIPECAETAAKAAQSAGIPLDHIVLFNVPPAATNLGAHTTARAHVSVDELVELGSESDRVFEERKLLPGEAKTKLAFLNFSSGTTGKPKASCLSSFFFTHVYVLNNIFPTRRWLFPIIVLSRTLYRWRFTTG